MDQSSPGETGIIHNGAVVFSVGIIRATGDAKTIQSENPDATIVDLGDAVILPGLINAHTHLELSLCTAEARPPDETFADWILSMRQRSAGAEDFESAAHAGISQCLKFGVTCVGDISQHATTTRAALAASPLRAVSFGEVLGLGLRRSRFDELFPRAIDSAYASDRLRIGISPHAPYTVDLPGYQQCVRVADERSMPIMTHLAENPQENDFLTSKSGLFRDLWERIGSWTPGVKTFAGSPIAMAKSVGLLDRPTILAHVNYCDEADLALLAAGRASVAFCPRTHRYFGHPPHRWREMMARGINVCIGTDSCASSPDLNLLDDLRLLHEIAPDISASTLFQMSTRHAARALSCDEEIGSIAPGKKADFAAFAIRGNNPLDYVLESYGPPIGVWIDGRRVSGANAG
jgi:cytosine/adenosine deaminase-related metal-dependent hydrolase